MTTETGGRRPRRSDNALLDTVEGLATGVGKFGYGLLSLGLDLLPRQSRQHMHNAIHELSHAFATLPRDFAEIAGAEIERWADGTTAGGHSAAESRVQHITISEEPAPAGAASATSSASASSAWTTTLGATATATAAAAAVAIAHIEFDSPGRDIDGEYVLVRNEGLVTADLTGWILRDGGARHSYVFPAFSLAPGAEVRIWTRAGKSDGANLYWGNRSAIWNNDGDSATLSDASGSTVASFSYQGK